jgi:hypothetical protein
MILLMLHFLCHDLIQATNSDFEGLQLCVVDTTKRFEGICLRVDGFVVERDDVCAPKIVTDGLGAGRNTAHASFVGAYNFFDPHLVKQVTSLKDDTKGGIRATKSLL